MHEGAITRALVDQVIELVPEGGRLVKCTVAVGTLEHLDALVMQTMWSAMIEGTPLAGAGLEIERVALRVRCGGGEGCGAEFEPEDPAILVCPACGRVCPEVIRGSGIMLKTLEVET